MTPRERAAKEESFFTRIRLQNGLFKNTSEKRLDDVNDIVLRHLGNRWATEKMRVLDVAVSSGITTIELARALRRSGRAFKILGTDLCIEASLLSYGRHFHVLHDNRGRPLQFEVSGFPVSNYFGARRRPWLRRIIPVLLMRGLFAAIASPACHPLVGSPVSSPVRLLAWCWREDPDVEFVQEDLFAEPANPCKYHLIRAANVLNLGIFSKTELQKAIKLMIARLETGGELVVLRTHHDGSNHGAVYELQGDLSLRPSVSFGAGCEIEPIVLSAATGKTV